MLWKDVNSLVITTEKASCFRCKVLTGIQVEDITWFQLLPIKDVGPTALCCSTNSLCEPPRRGALFLLFVAMEMVYLIGKWREILITIWWPTMRGYLRLQSISRGRESIMKHIHSRHVRGHVIKVTCKVSSRLRKFAMNPPPPRPNPASSPNRHPPPPASRWMGTSHSMLPSRPPAIRVIAC